MTDTPELIAMFDGKSERVHFENVNSLPLKLNIFKNVNSHLAPLIFLVRL